MPNITRFGGGSGGYENLALVTLVNEGTGPQSKTASVSIPAGVTEAEVDALYIKRWPNHSISVSLSSSIATAWDYSVNEIQHKHCKVKLNGQAGTIVVTATLSSSTNGSGDAAGMAVMY